MEFKIDNYNYCSYGEKELSTLSELLDFIKKQNDQIVQIFYDKEEKEWGINLPIQGGNF